MEGRAYLGFMALEQCLPWLRTMAGRHDSKQQAWWLAQSLRAHVLNPKHEAEGANFEQWEISKLQIPPPAAHLLPHGHTSQTSPNSEVKWEISVQRPESVESVPKQSAERRSTRWPGLNLRSPCN